MLRVEPRTWRDMPHFGPLPDDEFERSVAINKRRRAILRAREQYALKLKRDGRFDGQGSR